LTINQLHCTIPARYLTPFCPHSPRHFPRSVRRFHC
jgi:hypothetical protein